MQLGKPNFLLAAGAVLCLCAPAAAQLPPPPPPPATLWSFLGIPQGVRAFRDNAFNRNGNNPNAERKPPLKPIADPKNLKSEDPAIKKAAEIKQAEDAKKQKIKAIKYLASIGCGCYNRDGSITDALLKSMDDCTEEVRLATVQSISLAAASEMCSNCKQRSCCSEELSNKLYEIAYERDETGCYLEPSERVRLAAAEALRVCCPGGGEDIIFDTAPPAIPPSGGEQPSVLPESGGERPALPPIPGPTPAVPPGPNVPPGALPTDPPPPLPPAPAPAAGPATSPRSSRRTAMLNSESKSQVATVQPTTEFAEIGTRRPTPHWSPLAHEPSVFFRSPAGEPQPLDELSAEAFAPAVALDESQPPAENFAPIVTRLPPVEDLPAQHQLVNAELAPPPLPDRGLQATPVSVRRPARQSENAAPQKPAATKKAARAAAQRKLPGQEFGVGTVTSVRFKEGLAILEFENSALVPAGSIIRAYHEFALTGKSPVCDLEVVDGGDGRTVAVARSGHELTTLNVGDRAIVLQ
jgi:hypothetical protein